MSPKEQMSLKNRGDFSGYQIKILQIMSNTLTKKLRKLILSISYNQKCALRHSKMISPNGP